MSKQVETLIKGKQQTEGTLSSLKRQVDALGELVSSTSSDSLFPSLNASLQEDLNWTKDQVSCPSPHMNIPEYLSVSLQAEPPEMLCGEGTAGLATVVASGPQQRPWR